MTIAHLRPNPQHLGDEWLQIVEAEYEQVERLREWRNSDYYQPIANQFTDDPWRHGDEILDALRAFGKPDSVWLDIGAGGGRYALPLSLTSKRVIAVDPSTGMHAALASEIERHGIQNIEQVDLRWPEGADGIEADFSLAAHVGYDIRNINAFIDGMEQATRERCVVLMMDRAPSGGFDRLWEQVHVEPRMRLPAMREFVQLLLARGAAPEIRNFAREHEEWTPDSLLVSARRRLWLAEGSDKDLKLQELLLQEGEAGVSDYQLPVLISMIAW